MKNDWFIQPGNKYPGSLLSELCSRLVMSQVVWLNHSADLGTLVFETIASVEGQGKRCSQNIFYMYILLEAVGSRE